MADQVEIQLPRTVVDERSQFVATARFRQQSDATASVPTTVDYRIFNRSTNQIITDWTSVTPAAEVSITIKATENKINTNFRNRELFELIVSADRGLDTEVMKAIHYTVRNISGFRENV